MGPINTDGIQYPFMAGCGALLGLLVSLLLCVVAIFVPSLWPYVLAPVGVGAVIGFVWAGFIR